MGNSSKKTGNQKPESSQIQQKLQDSVIKEEVEESTVQNSGVRFGDAVVPKLNQNQISGDKQNKVNDDGLPRTISWRDFKGEELTSVREYQPSEDGDHRGWCCTIM